MPIEGLELPSGANFNKTFVVQNEASACSGEKVIPSVSAGGAVVGTPKKRIREDVGAEPQSKTVRKQAEPEKKK
jgi:hypothetical protein